MPPSKTCDGVADGHAIPSDGDDADLAGLSRNLAETRLAGLASVGIVQHLPTRQKRQEICRRVRVDAVVTDSEVLGRQLHGVHRTQDLGLRGPVLHADEVGDGDRGQDADDDHDDHELNQGKTSALLRHVLFLLWKVRSLRCLAKG